MKTNSKLLVLSGAFFFAVLVGGCATGSPSSMDGMSGKSGKSGGQMDMQAMCEKHKSMMAGKSISEQHAMMNENMRSMSPEMRTRMQAMHEKCNAS